ncbi:hypothetical protein Z043_117232 [Scleropages formosus]|uniref:Death domain-containing protein CRADD-like n=1 Tax=Scleropages formosus TaxID=113540 RepID=A0A0P7WRE7_SCLFO|nr:uncharacterized protein LOC108939400 [Scleropages formosus]KPP64424.1 hypothetical protein Z043_117232 [Scleropages formosus]
MEKEPEAAGCSALLRTLKATLIDALSADPDFVLQHADSRSLLTVAQYQHIKVIADPSQKVCDLLDCVIQRGSGCSKKLLKLLKEEKIQETYPKLGFLKKPSQLRQMAGGHGRFKRKRERNLEPESPIKQNCVNRAELVTERQLMILADRVGHSWKQMGLVALRITAVQLEQLEEDYPRHVERVFGMLQAWRMREGRQATAVRLYDLLSRGNFVPPESLDILLESSGITGAPSHVVR